ncbi:DUF6452 family protein [Oceanihabitans sp. 2_MG-2023]|uniref:DUF6452 family protein n=1 Tax=Oceanihabitans sp. 2_MG-2023 TaxID=3062661 RepID=UPI0026E23478|nr:DUF6452 family protein [Oceanihabitans sp. 2_MG-2023]MDO6597502.1 DUF6452 family protein [Oceanihabitans sp. 2_MG-2023]
MKKLKIILIPVLILFTIFLSCERDDLCSDDTSTTAHLYMQFYNSANTENLKNVLNFRAQGVDNDAVLSDYDVVTANSVYLPLKTTETSTQFKLHNDYSINDNGTPDDDTDDYVDGNEDIITIHYVTKLEYVSKACGYKTVFENVTISIEDDGDKWIDYILSTTDNEPISNEDEAHFNLFH